jgi:integrase
MIKVSAFSQGSRLSFTENSYRLRYLMPEEVDVLLEKCPPHLAPMVKLALNTGLRRGELLSLQWDQVVNGFIYLWDKTKTATPRQIPLNEAALEVLEKQRRLNHLKSPYVFCDKHGKPWKDNKEGFANACRRAGIFNFRFHDLRHTFASHLAMNGESLRTIAELLGHKTFQMVMRYAHLSPGHLHKAVQGLSLGSPKQNGQLLGNFLKKREKGRQS